MYQGRGLEKRSKTDYRHIANMAQVLWIYVIRRYWHMRSADFSRRINDTPTQTHIYIYIFSHLAICSSLWVLMDSHLDDANLRLPQWCSIIECCWMTMLVRYSRNILSGHNGRWINARQILSSKFVGQFITIDKNQWHLWNPELN